MIRAEARRLGCTVTFFQSAHEGALIDAILDARSAVGVAVLPLDAPVEVELIVEVG